MSLSLRDKYIACLAADSVTLVKLRQGFSASVLERQQVSVIPVAGSAQWASAIEELDKLLLKSQRGLSLSVVLSNQFIRYKVIPAMPPLTAASKLSTIATHCFRESYGDAVDGWLINLNPLPDGDSMIASAVDASLISALQALATQRGCKLNSIQPALMSGFNTARNQVKATTFCYAQLESGRITLALSHDGAWQTISGSVASDNWPQQLAALVAREILLAGWQELQPTIYIHTVNIVHDQHACRLFADDNPWPTERIKSHSVNGLPAGIDHSLPVVLSVVD